MTNTSPPTALIAKALKLQNLLLETIRLHKKAWEDSSGCPEETTEGKETLQQLRTKIYLYDKELKAVLQEIQTSVPQGSGNREVSPERIPSLKASNPADTCKPPCLKREGNQDSNGPYSPQKLPKSSELDSEEAERRLAGRDDFMTALALVSVETSQSATSTAGTSHSSSISGETGPGDHFPSLEPALEISLQSYKPVATKYLEANLIYSIVDQSRALAAGARDRKLSESSAAKILSSTADFLSEKLCNSNVNLLKRKRSGNNLRTTTLTLSSPFKCVKATSANATDAKSPPRAVFTSNMAEVTSPVQIKRVKENSDMKYVDIRVPVE